MTIQIYFKVTITIQITKLFFKYFYGLSTIISGVIFGMTS